MSKLLADYQAKVDQSLREQAGRLTPSDKDAFIQEAVVEHSRHRPLVKVADFSGDAATYDIPLGAAGGMTDWQEGFSVVRAVEYPAGEREPIYLEADQWIEYVTPTGRVLRLLEDTPQVGEKVRISYGIMHTVSASTGTIPENDFPAVCNLAAAFAAHALSLQYAQLGDSTIGADSADHKSKSEEYAAASKRLRALYFAHMGINDEQGAGAASATRDWDAGPGYGGDYLTHPKEWR